MSNSHAADLRQRVHARLESLSDSGGDLAVGSANDSAILHSFDGIGGRWKLARARLHAELLDPFRRPQAGTKMDGRCAVATAGPPAAGKSSAIATVLGDVTEWRRVDADDFKVRLVEHALANDLTTYRDVMSIMLPDGEPVMPMELAGLFHIESTVLARRALELCLRSGEDVVIEGTLQWDGLVDEYSASLARAGYMSLVVVDVQTPLPVALERAKSRWWEGRLTKNFGGRFTPPRAIESMYDQPDGASRCSVNARRLVEASRMRGLEASLEILATDPPQHPDHEELTA